MKRRSFLSLFFGAVCAILCGLGLRRREPELHLFWMGEESEVFVAPSIDALNKEYGRGREHARIMPKCEAWPDGAEFFEELLTPQNEGDEWGYADLDMAEIIIDEETGEETTFAQALERLRRLDWFQKNPVVQLATSYN